MRGLAAGRRLALAGVALVVGASLHVIAAPTGDSNVPNKTDLPASESQHLAVVVPAYQGDLDRAVASLERWPTNCSPLTVENVDLVLYYAEGEEDKSAVEEAAGTIAVTAGRCFANFRIVYAHLEKEEDAYPKGPSVMFYKMFLDADVRSQLSEFDALAIVEWDVLVATDRSFEELYHAAFRVNEEFWVKGSNLEGTNLHSSAEVSEMWRVLGHINGNAIYNNNDPAFVEYIEYTRARWEYEYPYDVALWLTISDFPYSWPLYQRYSSKFVITNLISYVGYEHVTHDTVSDAIAGQTLFIHGSRVDDGSRASIKSAAAAKQSKAAPEIVLPTDEDDYSVTSTSKRRLKGANATPPEDGRRRLFRWSDDGKMSEKASESHANRKMTWISNDDSCDVDGCPWIKSNGKFGRVCDDSCTSGDPYGTLGCGARNGKYGPNCRFCYYDVERALKNDTPENRAIMCDTLKPVDIYAVATPAPTPDPGCDVDGCPWIKSNGHVGRVCDVTCTSGDPYGTLGCGARNGKYGPNCRFCYYDVERALKNGTPKNPAIMCDTMMPVDPYSRRLTDTVDLSTSSRPKTEMVEMFKSERMFEEAASRPFQGDVTTGNLCAFVAGRAGEVDEWTVTVRSIQKFAPGMRVAVAAEEDAVVEYERALSSFPGVKVSSTVSAVTAGLYADKYCGADDTSLIMYLNRGSVLSRSFTSKDTHSPRGELLVVHGNARASYRDSQLAKHTAFLLESDAPAPPSFTYGTDLLLPVGANADVREQLLSVDAEEMQAAMKFLEDLDDLTAVPQVLAALQYSRQTEGIWFVDPQAWVSQHLFKETSIWDIPLVKPRFTCAISPTILRQRDDVDAADLLEDSLDFFSRGGKCPNGQIDVKPDGRRA